MTDPKSMNASDMPRNREVNVAGESCGSVHKDVHQGCLLEGTGIEEEEEEAPEEEEYVRAVVEKEKGKGKLRVWFIMEHSSYKTLDWSSSSSSWSLMILSCKNFIQTQEK